MLELCVFNILALHVHLFLLCVHIGCAIMNA